MASTRRSAPQLDGARLAFGEPAAMVYAESNHNPGFGADSKGEKGGTHA
jgi:hypothetical protein